MFGITLLLIFSCTKQDAPNIETSETRSQKEIERLEACSIVNLNKGVLLHLNTILLFKCTQWDEQFPKIFQAIKRMRSSSWDHFMAPVDKEFVENHVRRDRFFRNIKELDSKNGLDDLSRVLVALNETNFFDSLKNLFRCVETGSEDSCENRKEIPKKKSLLNIIKLVDTHPDAIDRASSFVKKLNLAIDTNEEKLRTEINKFRSDPFFIRARLELVDALAEKSKLGLNKDDREFLSNLLLIGSADQKEPWIYSWMHDLKMNRDIFRDLVEYPILINPNIEKEFRGLRAAYDNGLFCKFKASEGDNETIDFDLKTHLKNHGQAFLKRNYRDYFDYLSSLIVGLKLSSEICSELEKNNDGFSFLTMITSHAKLLSQKKHYDLFKFIAGYTTLKGDLDKNFSENLYLPDLIASDLFARVNSLNTLIVTHTREFYPTLFDIIWKLPTEALIDGGVLLREVLQEKNDVKLRGLADLWKFFNTSEKNFLFNFVDRHFEGDTQFVLLFDFYAKFLDELRDTQPTFKDQWAGDEQKIEMSYLSLQDFVENLAGAETLKEFKTFFGRDHILKILEILASGSEINKKSQEELAYRRSDEYIKKAEGNRYIFKIVYDQKKDGDGDMDTMPMILCMDKMSQLENGFYYLVKDLPAACRDVIETNISFRLFSWLNKIEKSYRESFPSTPSAEGLFDKRGILSPLMLNTSMGTIKILDNLLGEIDSSLPTQNGIDYLLNSFRFYLIERGALNLLDQNIALLNQWLEIMPEENLIYRNALLKSFSQLENFSDTKIVIKNMAEMASLYGNWVKEGNLKKTNERSFGESDPASDCGKTINQFVAPYPCPSKEIVKKYTASLINTFAKTWESEQGSPIQLLLKAAKPGEGLDIPLGEKTKEKYRLTLKEAFKYLYDASDKTLPINRVKIFYMHEDGREATTELTTLERIEVVIREVRFDNNYLGVSFLNGITHASDYDKEAQKRKNLLSTCLKVPLIRCGKPMGKNDLRMGRNALETFDSLMDINTWEGKNGEKFNYGNFLKTFEQSLVASSAKKAQESQLLPLKKEHLLKHNGTILADMTMMTAWSNIARILRDRVGKTRGDFNKFINSANFNRVNKALLYGFDLPRAAPAAESLLKKLLIVPKNERENLANQTIDWLASLNDKEVRLLEDTLSRLLLAGAYLGSPQAVFENESNDDQFKRYADNNLFQLFLASEKIIDYWPTLKRVFPEDTKLIDVIKPINNGLVFLTDKLAENSDPHKNIAYKALNDFFGILQATFFKEQLDPRINVAKKESTTGLELTLGFLKRSDLVKEAYEVTAKNYKYLEEFHKEGAKWFRVVGQNINRMVANHKIELSSLRDYLSFTTKNLVCTERDLKCEINSHFDEIGNLVKFLNTKDKNGESHLRFAVKTVMIENFDQINNLLGDLLPALKIKQIRPPLQLD